MWVAKAYAVLETVIKTGILKGRRAFEAPVWQMIKPVLPFLDTQTREQLRHGFHSVGAKFLRDS
jgi:hypothetical protein